MRCDLTVPLAISRRVFLRGKAHEKLSQDVVLFWGEGHGEEDTQAPGRDSGLSENTADQRLHRGGERAIPACQANGSRLWVHDHHQDENVPGRWEARLRAAKPILGTCLRIDYLKEPEYWVIQGC